MYSVQNSNFKLQLNSHFRIFGFAQFAFSDHQILERLLATDAVFAMTRLRGAVRSRCNRTGKLLLDGL